MSYAIRKDGTAWRAVNGPGDVGPDENFSETQPVLQPTIDQIAQELSSQIQKRLDDFARQREYDSMASLVSYVGDADPTFSSEGAHGKLKRSQTWAAMKQIRSKVLAGNWPSNGANQMPTSIADIEAELPTLTWPA